MNQEHRHNYSFCAPVTESGYGGGYELYPGVTLGPQPMQITTGYRFICSEPDCPERFRVIPVKDEN